MSSIKSNGKLRGRKRYRCNLCLHQWVDKRGKKTDYKRYYLDWLHKRRTLAEIASILDISIPKLTKNLMLLSGQKD
ncbi:MAG: hypothetical protein R3D71_07290 [Rickettsiales bacterium]